MDCSYGSTYTTKTGKHHYPWVITFWYMVNLWSCTMSSETPQGHISIPGSHLMTKKNNKSAKLGISYLYACNSTFIPYNYKPFVFIPCTLLTHVTPQLHFHHFLLEEKTIESHQCYFGVSSALVLFYFSLHFPSFVLFCNFSWNLCVLDMIIIIL